MVQKYEGLSFSLYTYVFDLQGCGCTVCYKVPTFSFLLPLPWRHQVPACCDTYLQNYIASYLSRLQFYGIKHV